MKKQNVVLVLLLVAFTLLVSGCGSAETGDDSNLEDSKTAIPNRGDEDFGTSDVDWRTYTISDVGGEEFRISDFNKPVLLETFAVWCTNCEKQQAIVTQLHEVLGDDVVTIAIEIDPNAQREAVAAYAADRGFTSQYVVAPNEFTQSLVDEFGVGIVSAPSVPMLFICGDEVTKLRNGIKPLSELKELVESCNG